MIDTFSILIQREDLTAFTEQVNEVSSITASGIEYAHTGRNVSTQNLVEDIDIDLPELFLHG
jgi:hypothetical protein